MYLVIKLLVVPTSVRRATLGARAWPDARYARCYARPVAAAALVKVRGRRGSTRSSSSLSARSTTRRTHGGGRLPGPRPRPPACCTPPASFSAWRPVGAPCWPLSTKKYTAPPCRGTHSKWPPVGPKETPARHHHHHHHTVVCQLSRSASAVRCHRPATALLTRSHALPPHPHSRGSRHGRTQGGREGGREGATEHAAVTHRCS
jgi:hypothetical protein